MHDPISIIMCVVGVIGCIIGIASYVSAQITKAKDDGILMAKVDQLVASLEELKKDTKSRNLTIDNILDDHTKDIENIKARLKAVEKEVFNDTRDRE